MNIHKMFPKMFPATITFDTTLSKVLNVAFPQLEVQSFNATTVIVKFPTTGSDLILGISVDVNTYVGDLNVKLGGTFFEVKNKNIGALIDIAGSIYRTHLATTHFLSTFVRSRVRKIKFLSAITNDNSDYTARFDKTFSEFVVVTRFAEFCEVVPNHLSNIAFLEMFFKARMDADFLTESAVNLMVESVINTVSMSDPDVCTVVDSCESYLMELLKDDKPKVSDNILVSLDSVPYNLEKVESWVRENFNTIAETKEAMVDFYDFDWAAHKRLDQAKTYSMLAKFILDFILVDEEDEEDEDFDQLKQRMYDIYNDIPVVWTGDHIQNFVAWSEESFETIEKLQNFLASVLNISDLDRNQLMSINSYENCAKFAILALDSEDEDDGNDEDEDEDEDTCSLCNKDFELCTCVGEEDEDEDDEDDDDEDFGDPEVTKSYTELRVNTDDDTEDLDVSMSMELARLFKPGLGYDQQTECVTAFFSNVAWWKLRFNMVYTGQEEEATKMMELYLGECVDPNTTSATTDMIKYWLSNGF